VYLYPLIITITKLHLIFELMFVVIPWDFAFSLQNLLDQIELFQKTIKDLIFYQILAF